MAEPTPPTTPDTPLYNLVAAKLGRDPLEMIRERRKAGVPYAKITDELKRLTNVYLTHEAPRRWLLKSEAEAATATDEQLDQALNDAA